MTRPVTVVIPVWNGIQHVLNLLPDLKATLPAGVQVIWIENGSVDGARDVVFKACKKTKHYNVVANDQNIGFTQAINQGILSCDTDVILLNTDIRLGIYDGGELQLNKHWVEDLQAVAQGSVGIVVPRLRDLNGGLNTTHAYVDHQHRGYPEPGYTEDHGQYSATEAIESGTFALAYITRECIEQCGLMEEQMAVYCSDSAYCITARMKGFQVWRAGNVTLTHAVGGSLANASFNYNQQIIRDTEVFKAACPVVRPYRMIGGRSCQVNITGALGYLTGYSKLSWNIGRALRKSGVDVRMIPLYSNDRIVAADPAMLGECINRPFHQNAPTVACCPPTEAKNWSRGKRIMCSMLEVDGVPQQIIEPLNTADEFWTFSYFNYATFRNSGCNIPIRIIPPPVDTDFYNPSIKPYNLPKKRGYNIVAVFEWGERKFVEWIEVALRAFVGHDDVTLHLRTYEGNQGIQQTLAGFAQQDWNQTVVHWITDTIPEHEMGSFYRAADLVVAIGAEGIGMPALEAMACGVPVIGFDWGAGGEYAGADRCLSTWPVGLVDAQAVCPYYNGFHWGYPDWYHFARLLRYAYHNREEVAAKASSVAPLIHKAYNLNAVGAKYVEALFC